jgi:Dolichyl-phosphate-mannose-protein mannosyltransferase
MTIGWVRRIVLLSASVWLIAAVAFAARAAFIWNQQRRIPHNVLATVPFEQEAGNIALSLSEGSGYGNLFRKNTGPTAWLAPAYPFFLSLIFRSFGTLTLASFLAAVLLNAALSAAATFPLFAIARRLAGVREARAAAWAWAVLPSGVLMPFEWIWDTSLSVLLAVVLVWSTLRLAETSRLLAWSGYGLLWGTALLVNPVLGAGLPFLAAWAFVRRRAASGASWRLPAAAAAVALLCCLPWTLRNYARFHRLIPVRSSLPFELWIGNNDIFDEHAVSGPRRITRFEETRRYAQMGESAFLDEKSRLAWRFIREKPGLFLRLTGRRLAATWLGTEHPYRAFLAAPSFLLGAILGINLLLTLGTALGVGIALFRRLPAAWPAAVFPIFYPLVFYLTHTSLRYRHPVDPLLVVWTVFAAAVALRALRRRPARGAFTQ